MLLRPAIAGFTKVVETSEQTEFSHGSPKQAAAAVASNLGTSALSE